MLFLRNILLCLAVVLTVITLTRLSIDFHLQTQGLLDGPLANSFQKAEAIRDIAISFSISALTFFLISKVSFASVSTKTQWISNYLLISASLITISLIMFFWPFTIIGIGKDFYFATWSTGLKSINFLLRDTTVIILITFIALRIRKTN
jgi:hypothetical protein